jgi:Na+-transporting NADH:ubiquinone oxidoreductase subunit F
MNNCLYEIASFMVMRESTVWRWSHTRHHSDTIIVGRDPEIAVPRPPDVKGLVLGAFGIPTYPRYFKRIVLHSFGKMEEDEMQFIPESEFPKVFCKARVHLLIYLCVIALAIATGSILPLMFIGLPHLFGTWLMLVYGLTQHTGLAENVLDHRLNCRTVEMNAINRFLYWNMNYHVEHHMFPLVPYHALPELHEAVKHDCPQPVSASGRCFCGWPRIPPSAKPSHWLESRAEMNGCIVGGWHTRFEASARLPAKGTAGRHGLPTVGDRVGSRSVMKPESTQTTA